MTSHSPALIANTVRALAVNRNDVVVGTARATIGPG
jgi:hypothetical protein